MISLPIPLQQGTEVELHILPYSDYTEVRLWYKGEVLKVVHYKDQL